MKNVKMMNIKQIVIALAIFVSATTPVFAMEKDCIYDDVTYTKDTTYYKLIDEAAKAKLIDVDHYKRFMNFVRAFPTKNLNNYDLKVEKGVDHPQYKEREFFRNMLEIVKTYTFPEDSVEMGYYSQSMLAKYNLDHGLTGIVDQISSQLVGMDTD